MREVERVMSRRAWLKRMAIGAGVASAALVVGPAMFDALEQMFPRRLVPGVAPDRALWEARVVESGRLSMERIRRVRDHIFEHSQVAQFPQLTMSRVAWNDLLREEYVKGPIIEAIKAATPMKPLLQRVSTYHLVGV